MTRKVLLEDVVGLEFGFPFKSAKFNTEGRGLPLVRIRDVVPGFSNTYYDGDFDSRYLVTDGDYLIGMDGEFNLGRWCGGKALLNQRVAKLGDAAEGVDRGYIARFLPAALKAIEDETPFVTVKHLSAKRLRAIEVPLPPLDEQRRIAAILGQADALRVRRGQVLLHLDTIAESLFLDMFGKFSGKFLTVQEVAAPDKGSIRTGPFGSQLLHEEFVDEGIAVLGLDNVVGNQFTWKQRRFITPEKYDQLRRYTVQPGDVLVSIMGTCGRCVVVPADVGTAINTKHICAITVDRNLVVPEFVRAAFLWHPRARQHLTQRTKGSIMDGLNMGIIKEMPLPVPQLKEQQDFVAALHQVNALSQPASESSVQLDDLFESLQSRAFTGQL